MSPEARGSARLRRKAHDLPALDRPIILVLDGDPEDHRAVAAAAQATGGEGSRLLVLFVPVSLSDWAHWELGDDPDRLRYEIEWQQYRTTMRMLEEAGIDGHYRMQHMGSRRRFDDLVANLDGCEELIVSTAGRIVRTRLARLARRRNVSLRLTPRD